MWGCGNHNSLIWQELMGQVSKYPGAGNRLFFPWKAAGFRGREAQPLYERGLPGADG
jgi:hypothetical protein